MTQQRIRTRNTRTGDPRKIDEWSVKLPGGKSAKFDVLLQYGDVGAMFTARSSHPDFAQLRPQASDLNMLIDDLEVLTDQVIERSISADWAEGRKLEVRKHLRNRSTGDVSFSLSVNLLDVEFMPGARVGNRGETSIRTEHRQEVVVQRALTDDFSDIRPASGNLMDPEVRAYLNSPLCGEENEEVTRSILPGREADAVALMEALDRFGGLIAARLAPHALSTDGMPVLSDLCDLMREAVGDPGELPQP